MKHSWKYAGNGGKRRRCKLCGLLQNYRENKSPKRVLSHDGGKTWVAEPSRMPPCRPSLWGKRKTS